MPRLRSTSSLAAWCLAVACCLAPAGRLAAQPAVGSAFTYQGALNDGGVAANGTYDFQFLLYDAASGGTQMGNTIDLQDVAVSNGVFSVRLDFGSSWFLGSARWLEVQVRPGASTDPYSTIGRQELTPTPFAMALSLPMQQNYSTPGSVVQFINNGSGNGGRFMGGATGLNYGVLGQTASGTSQAAGVRGEATANSGNVIGVQGVATSSPSGTGLVGSGSATGAYVSGTGGSSTGLYAYGYALGIHAENLGSGSAVYATGSGSGRENATVRINNDQPSAGMAQYVTSNSNWATTHMENGGSGEVLWLQRGATAGHYIVATNGSDWKFWVDASGVTHTKVLEILGGADLSERFDVRDGEAAIEPGTVVSIDPEHEGRLAPSRQGYDHRVAGIISGAGGVKPGMVMAQEGSIASGEHPVALTGRVYCRATAANGPIRPGDLLTTSDVPGHAMRVTDTARAQGAVLGKAMGTLEEGEGLVLVLVGLQ